MNRVHSKIKPKIGQKQCSCVKDNGTRNAIFMFRMLTERKNNLQKDVYYVL